MIELLVVVLVIATLAVLFASPPERITAHAFGMIVAWNTIIPLRIENQTLAIGMVLASIILAVGARVRMPSAPPPLSPLTLFAAFFLIYIWIRVIPGSSDQYVFLQLAVTVVLALMLPLGASLTRENMIVVARYFAVLVTFHAIFALLEQTVRLQALWPLGDGTYDIGLRSNELLPDLPGRSMTSFSHPIPLSVFFAVAFIFLIFQVFRHKHRLFIFPAALAVMGLGLSGTRSTVVALAAAGAASLILSLRIRSFFAHLLAIIVVAVLALNVDILAALGLGAEFTSTDSFRHRTGVISSLPRILQRPPEDLFFGSGGNSAVEVLKSGLIRGVPGLNFFDNQFVAALVLWGVLGLTVLLIALVLAFVNVRDERRAVLVYTVGMFFAFDVLTWLLPSIFLFASLGITRTQPVASPDDDVREQIELRSADTARTPAAHTRAPGAAR